MDERDVQFRVGVVVFATLIIVAILVLLFGEAPTLFRRHYAVTVKLPRAPGVAEDTPVRKSGIVIGRVRDVTFAEDGQVLVTASIEQDIPLRRNERPRVTGSILGGDAALEFIPVKDPTLSTELIQEGEQIEGLGTTDPLEILANLEDNLTRTVDSLGSAGDQVARLAQRVDRLLGTNDERINDLLEKSANALQGIADTTGTLQNILGDPQLQENLRQTLTELPQLFTQVREALAGMGETVQLANENLRNLQGFTEPLREQGDQLVTKVNSSLDHLDDALGEVLTFVQAVNRSDGTLSKLVRNGELYDNLNQTVRNLEGLTKQLRPIMSDVRAFTDKVARDPGRLGVRGALRRPSGVK